MKNASPSPPVAFAKPLTLAEAREKSAAEKAERRKKPPSEPVSGASEPVSAPSKPLTRARPKKPLKTPENSLPEPPAATAVREAEASAQSTDVEEAFRLPYEPPRYVPPPEGDDPVAELAQRELCRRHLLPFIRRFRPKYLAGWVHADICRRLERFLAAVEEGKEPRLLMLLPPRQGKSDIASRHFPAWVLGHHPDWEIIAASHSASLTMSFSRYMRDMMAADEFQALFPDARLDPNSRSVENWNMTNGGGYLAAGVGTGISGRGCIYRNTLIRTMLQNSDTICASKIRVGGHIYGYDHKTRSIRPVKVLAVSASYTKKPLVRIDDVICTEDHEICTGLEGSYTRAGCLAPNVPLVRRKEISTVENVPGVLSPRRRGCEEQLGEQCGLVVLSVSQVASFREGVCAEELASGIAERDGEFVVDFQTETGNYFAGESDLLVHNCHILVIDDVVRDIEAADSATIRDNTWEWYISTAYTRLAPGGGVLGLLTWWNEDDWAGRIQSAMATGEGDWFEVVRYPAINELGDEYLLPDDTIVEIPEGAPVPPGAKRTRPKGTAIHPERYSTEAMLRIKRNALAAGMKRTWDALYQQNPIPDTGNFFTPEMIRHYGSAPDRRGMRVYQAWDFAISEGKGSDYNAGVTIGVDGRDNVHVLDLLRFKISDGNLLIETVVDYARRWQPDVLGVEDGQIWKALESQFEKVCRETRYYPSFEVLKPLTDKMVRASPLRGRMQAGRVYFPSDAGFWPEMKKELLHFPAGKNDDIVDSLSWAVRLTLSRAPPREAAPPEPKSWKDKLWMVMKGSFTGSGHMAA